jgi:Thiamine pyrophosphate enzyme, N-terminal TPP binding domain
MSQTVAGILVETLEAIGVRHVFGLIADSLNPIGDVVRQSSKVEWVGVRHGSARGRGPGEAHGSARRLLRINRTRQHPSYRRPL